MNKVLLFLTFIKVRWLERWPTRRKIDRHQEKGLRRFQSYMGLHSPYFREQGFQPDFMMDKAFMMANFDALNTVGVDREQALALALQSEKSRDFSKAYGNISVGLSSGTSGHYGIFLTSPREQAIWAGTILAKLLPKGNLFGHRIAFFLRSNNNLYQTVNSLILHLHYFDMQQPIEEHLTGLESYQPTLVVAPASVCLQLARAQASSCLNISPQRIFSVAEILEDGDRAVIERVFNQKVYQIYQATEGFLGASCQEGTLHLNEDGLLIEKEWLDEERFYPIITDFKRTSMPFYRYRLNDILQVNPESCPCGSALLAIKKIEGRSDDLFYLERQSGFIRQIYPDFIRRCLMTVKGIEDYQVTQNTLNQWSVGLSVWTAEIEQTVRANVMQLAEEFDCRCPELLFIPYEPPARGAKLRRIKQGMTKQEILSYETITD